MFYKDSPPNLRGKVNYKVSSKIDTGLKLRNDEIYGNLISRESLLDRNYKSTGPNTRAETSLVRFYLSFKKIYILYKLIILEKS